MLRPVELLLVVEVVDVLRPELLLVVEVVDEFRPDELMLVAAVANIELKNLVWAPLGCYSTSSSTSSLTSYVWRRVVCWVLRFWSSSPYEPHVAVTLPSLFFDLAFQNVDFT